MLPSSSDALTIAWRTTLVRAVLLGVVIGAIPGIFLGRVVTVGYALVGDDPPWVEHDGKRFALRPVDAKANGKTPMAAGIGLYGLLVDDEQIEVEIADGVRVRQVRSMVTGVRAKGEPVKDDAS